MKKNLHKIAGFLFVLLLCQSAAQAYWVWSPEQGKFVNPEGASQDSAEEQYDYAMQFYKEKNLDEALKQLENLIKKYPAARVASEAQYRRATIYEERGDFWRAFQTYKDLVESYPHSDRIEEVMEREFKIGNVFFSGKKAKWMGLEILPSLPRAAQVFEHIVATSPYGPYGDEAQFRLGLTRKKSNQFGKAMEAFQYLIEQYPQSEFVPEARYQLAETSFLNSAAAFRDERALDQAASNVDKYLSRYGTSEEAEKAAKLRQAIDEKNAEKNYRIGHYYEKQKHLESALIYYTDVTKRYPSTKWGVKAGERMRALQQPVEFIKGQTTQVDQELEDARRNLQALGEEGSDLERGALKREIERLEQKRKAVDKNKKESIEARRDDLNRREQELKEKYKKLKEKQKLLAKNPSEDLKRALDRWAASLEAEKGRLQEERAQLLSWKSELGMKDRQFSLAMLPFVDEDLSQLEKIRRIEAKKYYEISGEKKDLLSEKELLYKQYGEVLTLLGTDTSGLALRNSPLAVPASGTMPAQVAAARKNLETLEKQLDEKQNAYRDQYHDGWLGAPVRAVARSWDALNPFSGTADLSEKNLDELLERRMHLREQISAQQALVDTLNQAFDSELAVQEQKRLLAQLQGQEKENILDLRKSIKSLEKNIRRGYDEIDERHKHKKDLLKQLNALLGETKAPVLSQTAKVVALPVEAGRIFLFGRKPQDVKITESAAKEGAKAGVSAEAAKLKEEIELESLLIEDRYEKVLKMQRQLEALKAQASLAGGYKFRSAFVKIPYAFIQEAVESADRLVPRKDRQETLIHLLDKETRDLETLKEEQAALEVWVTKKSPAKIQVTPPQNKKLPAAEKIKENQSQQTQLQSEIQSLAGKVEAQRSDLQRTVSRIEETPVDDEGVKKPKAKPVLQKETKTPVVTSPKDQRKLQEELEKVEKTILKLIEKENELDRTEFSILEKRIKKIDEFVEKISSKAGAQDLLAERGRIENRLGELKLRRDFLNQELGRFNVQEPVKA